MKAFKSGLMDYDGEFNIEEGLAKVIHILNRDTDRAVLLNNQSGEFFRTTLGFRQGCFLSPVLINSSLEQPCKTPHTTIKEGAMPVFNLRFAEDNVI